VAEVDTAQAAPAKAPERARPSGGSSTRLAARAQRQQQRPRRPRRRLSGAEAKALRGEEKTMLIHEHEDRTQIAVLEKTLLIEHYVAHRRSRTMAGNVYLGKVQNVLPGMEAAFVDIGRGRNAVLYAGEVNYSVEDLEGGEAPRIERVLKPGQAVMVQVTKDPLGTKGARLTAQISLAGRYLVLAPEQQVYGISRRLAEDERARLRSILRDIKPSQHGVIVRTAAEGAPREAIERDLAHLVKIWDEITAKRRKAKAPELLYAEPELVMRVVRDIFAGDFGRVVCDSRGIYDLVREYLEDTAPDLLTKLELHEGPLPLFETYHVTEQIHKALERKVWLPSGGSIVIDRTEAMTVIDVNTGKFVGKGGSLEETVLKNNIEAAEEVARQLRLRDIGGIIVVDFIDMLLAANREQVLRTLKRALGRDKTRSQVFEVSSLGLVEMTRKRVSEGLLDAFSEPCPNCDGRGIVITHEID
jgi:ribonuclease E